MRIHYFSDIHLEFGPLHHPQTNADIIIAAGDVGVGSQGLEWLQKFSKPVIYVAGNHEFYNQDYITHLGNLNSQAEQSNVHFLERRAVILNDVRFLGCTLWTDLGGDENDKKDSLLEIVNDFRKIRIGDRLLRLDEYMELYELSRTWLFQELDKPFPGKTVIVTHHAPTPWSWDNSPNAIKRYAYCNNLKELLHTYEVTAWFHGHTHTVSDYRCAGAHILCNPRGYFPNQLVGDFDKRKIFEV